MQTFITESFTETQKIAEDFAKTLKGGEVLCFYGDLGYGKTTFIQGLAKGLGIEGRIISPTFIIMRRYKMKLKTQNSKFFYHVDLYRINSEQEIIDLGLLDVMHDEETIVAIEWPEKMGNLLPKKRIDVKLEYVDEDKRKISINDLKD